MLFGFTQELEIMVSVKCEDIFLIFVLYDLGWSPAKISTDSTDNLKFR